MQKEQLNYDIVIVGAGASGLSAAIRLKQLALKNEKDISICILEKGSEVGSHILSGAILDVCSLNELLPNWQELSAPLHTKVNEEKFYLLSKKFAFPLPIPMQMKNKGNYIISLGNLCRWLSEQAINLGVDIYSGFVASEILYNKDHSVKGVALGDVGLMRDGTKGSNYQQGMELIAKQTIFAEGCRGFLSQQLIKRYHLDNESDPQTYALGIKEIWEVDNIKHESGKVIHTIGWPLSQFTYGGSFLYYLENNQLALGSVIGLDYRNPYLSPFNELQRFKTHPFIRPIFDGARRIAYGARTLSEGGIQALPKLSFPGGALIGDAAGFLNVPRLKGIHSAIKSGMLCAEAIYDCVIKLEQKSNEASTYYQKFAKSYLFDELNQARNIRPAFRFGLFFALVYSAVDTYLFRGNAPWTFHYHQADNLSLKSIYECRRIEYSKPDHKLTFDRASSIYLSYIHYKENQISHLKLENTDYSISVNLEKYDAPEQRYCPAKVYEIVYLNNQASLHINAQNCIHCKACDIKDPLKNIIWSQPEGGSGPQYSNM